MEYSNEVVELLEGVLGEVIQESNPRQKFQQVLDNREVQIGKPKVIEDQNGKTITTQRVKNNPNGDKRLQKVVDDEISRLGKSRRKGMYQTGAFADPSLTDKDAYRIKSAYNKHNNDSNQKLISDYMKIAKKYRSIGMHNAADDAEKTAQTYIQRGIRDKENYRRMINSIPNATITTNRRGKTKIKYESAMLLCEAINNIIYSDNDINIINEAVSMAIDSINTLLNE